MVADITYVAEACIVNRNSPRSSSFVLRGKEAIAEYPRAISGKGTKHRIENEVLGEDRAAFNEACEYSDGTTASLRRRLESV